MPAKKKSKSAITKESPPLAKAGEGLNFATLVAAIRQVHERCAAQANRAVNVSLTLRNWVIGAYVHYYELNGQDRAEYGDGLLDVLAERLTALKVSNCNRRQLYRYLRFFRIYPEIWGTASPQLPMLADTLSVSTPLASREKVGTASPQLGAPVDSAIGLTLFSHYL